MCRPRGELEGRESDGGRLSDDEGTSEMCNEETASDDEGTSESGAAEGRSEDETASDVERTLDDETGCDDEGTLDEESASDDEGTGNDETASDREGTAKRDTASARGTATDLATARCGPKTRREQRDGERALATREEGMVGPESTSAPLGEVREAQWARRCVPRTLEARPGPRKVAERVSATGRTGRAAQRAGREWERLLSHPPARPQAHPQAHARAHPQVHPRAQARPALSERWLAPARQRPRAGRRRPVWGRARRRHGVSAPPGTGRPARLPARAERGRAGRRTAWSEGARCAPCTCRRPADSRRLQDPRSVLRAEICRRGAPGCPRRTEVATIPPEVGRWGLAAAAPSCPCWYRYGRAWPRRRFG